MHTQEELKTFAKVIMINPTSDRSSKLILTLAAKFQRDPKEVFIKIRKLTQG
jgi:hypothetical protein